MFHGRKGKNVLFAKKLGQIGKLCKNTLKDPDSARKDKTNQNRKVYKRRFLDPVGVHGLSCATCYTVTAVFKTVTGAEEIVTAFPSMSLIFLMLFKKIIMIHKNSVKSFSSSVSKIICLQL